jgi:hypothetical protein
MVLIELGEKEEAIKRVEKALREGESGLSWISVIPTCDAIGDDPRFINVLKGMNLSRD